MATSGRRTVNYNQLAKASSQTELDERRARIDQKVGNFISALDERVQADDEDGVDALIKGQGIPADPDELKELKTKLAETEKERDALKTEVNQLKQSTAGRQSGNGRSTSTTTTTTASTTPTSSSTKPDNGGVKRWLRDVAGR